MDKKKGTGCGGAGGEVGGRGVDGYTVRGKKKKSHGDKGKTNRWCATQKREEREKGDRERTRLDTKSSSEGGREPLTTDTGGQNSVIQCRQGHHDNAQTASQQQWWQPVKYVYKWICTVTVRHIHTGTTIQNRVTHTHTHTNTHPPKYLLNSFGWKEDSLIQNNKKPANLSDKEEGKWKVGVINVTKCIFWMCTVLFVLSCLYKFVYDNQSAEWDMKQHWMDAKWKHS